MGVRYTWFGETDAEVRNTHPQGQRGTVFSELEPDESIDEQTRVCSGYQTGIHSRKPLQRHRSSNSSGPIHDNNTHRIAGISSGYDTGI